MRLPDLELKEAREKAKLNNELYFSIERPCRHGHFSLRYVSTGICIECHVIRSKTKSVKDSNKLYYDKNKEARNEITKNWKKNNVKKVLGYNIKKYGLTVKEYDALLESQNNACAICKNPFEIRKHTHVDHCHDTGKIRGLLCNRCNLAIGFLNSSVEIALSAAEYLRGLL